VSRVSSALQTFWRWWTGELRTLLPRGPAAGVRASGPRIVLSIDDEEVRVIAERGGGSTILGRIAPLDEGGAEQLRPILASRQGQPIGLRFPSRSCFGRTLELPAQATAAFARILELDLERTTPFRAADVLAAHYSLPDQVAARGKTAVRHVIIKRRTIEPPLSALRTQGIEPGFADCWDEEGQRSQPLDFLAATHGAKPSRRDFAPAIAALLALLAISAAASFLIRHQSALDELMARTAEARTKAAAVRQRVEAAQAVSAQITAMDGLLRTRLPAARIFEELTVILPDSAWVTDLRMDGDLVEFTGFAKSAASLVPLLATSPLFSEAGLTSPVVLDSNEDKERFSIRLQLKGRTPLGAVDEASEAEERL
jgi:general secretion pathway protein L